MIFHTWNRFTKEHLPFYLNNQVPLEYTDNLYRQLFKMMGKLIYFTKGFNNRVNKRNEILNDINPIEVPFYIKWYLNILVIFPIEILLKLYVYYLSPWHVSNILKKGTINNIE